MINGSLMLPEDQKCIQGHIQGQKSQDLFALLQSLQMRLAVFG